MSRSADPAMPEQRRMEADNLKLRRYCPADSAVICRWIPDEKSLYQWSAGLVGPYPLSGDALDRAYASAAPGGRTIPLSAVDGAGHLVGHLFLRRPDGADGRTVRLGFVIVDPARRGSGAGRALLALAAAYARDTLCADRMTLAVFCNNDRARRCYEATGFCPSGPLTAYPTPFGVWSCVEMALQLA